MTKIILAAILWLLPAPSPKWNETREEFLARAEMIARSIDEAAQDAPPELRIQVAKAAAVVYWGESRFSPLVHSGEHKGDGGLAVCLGGHHRVKLTEEQWQALAGLDYEATLRCSRLTVKRLVSSWRYCQARDPRASWTEAMTLYGTGRTCRPEESKWKNIFLDRGAKHARLTSGVLPGSLSVSE